MGDMLTLIEKAQQQYDEKEAAELEKKIRKNEFTLEDFLEQMGQIKKMGGMRKVIDMLPGVNGQRVSEEDVDKSEREFVKMEAIIRSMTPEERADPKILNASRRKRIARGSGQPVSQINQLVKRYDEARKVMRQFTKPKRRGRKMRGGF